VQVVGLGDILSKAPIRQAENSILLTCRDSCLISGGEVVGRI